MSNKRKPQRRATRARWVAGRGMTDEQELEQLEAILSLTRPSTSPERNIAEIDQSLAANRDVTELVKAFGELIDDATYSEGAHPKRLKRMAVAGVIRCNNHRSCSHAARLPPSLKMMAALDLRTVACLPCSRELVTAARDPRYEDQCDLCLTHGHEMFTGFQLVLVNTIVSGNACDDCAALIGVKT